MAPRRRTPSVESNRRSERNSSPSHHTHPSAAISHRRDRLTAPPTSARREPESPYIRPHHLDSRSARDLPLDPTRRTSRDRSPSTSSRRPVRDASHRPDASSASDRRRDSSISSTKRRKERSPSPSHGPSPKYRRQASINYRRSPPPGPRYNLGAMPFPPYSHPMYRNDHHHHNHHSHHRRPSPDPYYSRRRSPPREPPHHQSRRPPSPFDNRRQPQRPRSPPHPRHFDDYNSAHRPSRGNERWEREPPIPSDHRESKRGSFLDRRPTERDTRDLYHRRSPSRDSRRVSPHRRLRSPAQYPSRGRTPPSRPSPRDLGPRLPREQNRAADYSRRPSRSPPPSGLQSRQRSQERGRPQNSDRGTEQADGTAASSRRHSKESLRSLSRGSQREKNEKMSWRPPYGQPPSRGGGWPSHDPRYSHSHSPPYGQGYGGSPPGNQPGYSPQHSPYPAQPGQADRGYFQQSPPYNNHHQSPHSHNSPSQTPNGAYPPRGGFRAPPAPFVQRFNNAQSPPAPAGAGPHVRNLSWTPKTGTRGGHAPTIHGANVHTLENKDNSATTPEEPSSANGGENPFRPASKELRVDDEAGKAGKPKEDDAASKGTEGSAQSPQIRFGLPKPGTAPVAPKPNPFQAKKNPFETSLRDASAADERRDMRTASQRFEDRNRRPEPQPEEPPPKRKGPKPALKHSVNKTFYDRRKAIHNVSWARLAQAHGDKELRQKLQKLRLTVISQGHPLKKLRWPDLHIKIETADPEDPPSLQEAIDNRSNLEEEAYRRHPKKRPSGQKPRLREGESLDTSFRKEVIAIKYKVRRPQNVLPEEYRNSNVYYRKPGNESVVGFGTYGKVFKAKHIYKGKDVALKRLRMEAEKDGFPITAMREMKILKHLEQRQGEGVIRLHELLYEVNLQNSVACFMVFEYMPHDLTGLLNHPTFKLTMAQKKDMARQMVSAIGFMHKNGVLHRDIKAANILVSHKGEIKLADFGLARFYDMDRQLHYTNRVVTIWYRAPELLYGQTEYGPAIDVWAAACVIVEIFTRHAIFPGNGKDLNQLVKVWEVMGFPTPEEWPAVSKTEWYFMMRPKDMMPNIFKEKYSSGDLGKQTTPDLLDLLAGMLRYNPANRPTCDECLEHPFFTSEDPPPERVTTELETLGDWHEFESKKAKRAKEAEDRVEKDMKEGPPSCGQFVRDDRRDKGYRKDMLMLLRAEKRPANFSPTEPEAKKIRA